MVDRLIFTCYVALYVAAIMGSCHLVTEVVGEASLCCTRGRRRTESSDQNTMLSRHHTPPRWATCVTFNARKMKVTSQSPSTEINAQRRNCSTMLCC